MKHIKLLFAVAILCAATFVGYNAYTNATMTEEERLIQANLEALMDDESNENKGTLMTTSSGTYYCCDPDGTQNNCHTTPFCPGW